MPISSKYDPTVAEDAAGKVENDAFLVNDIRLSIAPEQITVQRDSFSNEWQTLRTSGSRKANSGHSIVSVAFSAVFETNDSINHKLRPLVAGLRAFPFCTIHNEYLNKQLAELQNQVQKSYQQFSPIVLALTSMTVSTVPQKPGVLYGQFNFIWFNYYPYTPIWAYKTGDDFESPGPVWHSHLWEQFYKPYLDQTKTVNWPHLDPSVEPLRIKYKEFMTRWNGNTASSKAANELVDILKNKPSQALGAFKDALGNTKTTVDNSLSQWYQEMKKRGLISGQEEQGLQKLKEGQLEKSAGDVLFPLLRKLYSQAYKTAEVGQRTRGSLSPISGVKTTAEDIQKWKGEDARLQATFTPVVKSNLAAIDNAGRELANRYKRSLEVSSNILPEYWKEISEFSSVITFNTKAKTKVEVGGYKIFARQRELKIRPLDPNALDNRQTGYVIEGMSISFTPNLSIVPLIGHTHPTIQFTGGYNEELSITINGNNERIKTISQAYDQWENINLKYRRIPQKFRNLTLECDFVQLFGIDEWLPKSLHTATVQGQPGRTRAVLTLVDAGITTKDQVDDPERLKQEYIANDSALRREVFDILMKNLAPKEGKDHLLQFASSADLRHRAFGDLLIGAAQIINDFIHVKAKLKLFNGDGSYASSDAEYTYGKLMQLGNSDAGPFGYIPGLEYIQKTLKDIRDKGPDRAKRLATRSAKNVKHSIRRRDAVNYFTGKPEGGKDVDYPAGAPSLEDAHRTNILRLKELGLHKYQQGMVSLLDSIIHNPTLRGLPQFQHISAELDAKGIGKGKLAYPDFKKSLRGIASFLDAKYTDATLIDYDPDFFLWYPFLNGSLQNPVKGVIIDPFLVSQAMRHSQQLFDRAQGANGDIGSFFMNVYKKKLGGGLNQAPIKALEDLSGGKLAEPLYNKSTWKNSTLNPKEGAGKNIQITTTPDPAKIPINYYDNPSASIICPDSLVHSTDLQDLWGNVPVESGNAPQNKDKEVNEPVVPQEYGTALVPCQASPRWGVLPLAYEWPMAPSKQPPVDGLVCPLESYRYIQRSNSLGTRDIGKTAAGWGYRKKATVRDWKTIQWKLKKDGYSDPNKAPYHPAVIGKPYYGKKVSQWTWTQYMDWKKTTRLRLGYVHKGVDLMAGVGTKVYAIADGVVQRATQKPVRGAGHFVEIRHPSKPSGIALTRYLHLQAINPRLRRGTKIRAGDVIAVVGQSGQRSMVPHLHFECWSGRYLRSPVLDPLKVDIPYIKGKHTSRGTSTQGRRRLRQLAAQNVATDITGTLTSPLRSSIDEFEKRLIKGQAQRVVRALPTFRLYFIEDDSGQRKRLGFDDFFSYEAVKSIKVIQSRKIAADVCIIEMTNVSGTLSNRKYRNDKDADKPRDAKGEKVEETSAVNNPTLADTIKENPMASLLLQQGMDIHLKMGYSSDPSLLEPMFTGRIQIVEFSDTDDFVAIVAQSHATELTQDIKAIDKPKEKNTYGLGSWNYWGFGDNATTGRIIEEMLAQPEVVHFGRWERGDSTANRELLTNKFQFVPAPYDDNIFAPPPDVDLDKLGDGLFFKNISYFMYRTTIWDIFKEMELRHPNFIGSPVPYSAGGGNERMTYFFGMPNQLYFARAPTAKEQDAQGKVQQEERKVQDFVRTQVKKVSTMRKVVKKTLDTKVFGVPLTGLPAKETLEVYDKVYNAAYNASPVGRKLKKTVNEIYRKKRLLLAKEAGYIKPFRNYHLFTSNSHIVANNIRADGRDVANTIAIRYPSAKVEQKISGQLAVSQTTETFILKLDNALPTEDIRTQVGDYPNVKNYELAKRYALSLLCQNLKDVYKGSLIVIGEPSVKPYDSVYLFDEVSDMTGVIEVEQVIHSLDRDKGYLCEITPDMCVMASEWSLLGSLEALSIVMEGVIKKVWGRSPVDNARGRDPQFSPWSFMLAGATQLLGGMTAKKIINYTQLGQPVIMSPLLHHGREFSGGIATRKITTSLWDTMFGEWKQGEADESYHAWLEDVQDNIQKSIKKYTGGYATGSFLEGFTSNTVDNG